MASMGRWAEERRSSLEESHLLREEPDRMGLAQMGTGSAPGESLPAYLLLARLRSVRCQFSSEPTPSCQVLLEEDDFLPATSAFLRPNAPSKPFQLRSAFGPKIWMLRVMGRPHWRRKEHAEAVAAKTSATEASMINGDMLDKMFMRTSEHVTYHIAHKLR